MEAMLRPCPELKDGLAASFQSDVLSSVDLKQHDDGRQEVEAKTVAASKHCDVSCSSILPVALFCYSC